MSLIEIYCIKFVGVFAIVFPFIIGVENIPIGISACAWVGGYICYWASVTELTNYKKQK